MISSVHELKEKAIFRKGYEGGYRLYVYMTFVVDETIHENLLLGYDTKRPEPRPYMYDRLLKNILEYYEYKGCFVDCFINRTNWMMGELIRPDLKLHEYGA